MKIRVIAPIRGLQLEGVKSLEIEGALITNDVNIIQALDQITPLSFGVGQLGMQTLSVNYFFYYEGEPDEKMEGCVRAMDFAFRYSIIYSGLLSSFWYLKDNSLYLENCIVEIVGSEFAQMTTGNRYGNMYGEFGITKFTKDDLFYFPNVHSTVNKLSALKKEDYEGIFPVNIPNNTDISPIANILPYPNNRFARALMFLGSIRREHILIAKITLYITLYECLFTSGTKNLAEKVADRANAFFSKMKSNLDIKPELKNAYNIRSRYVHGDNFKGTYDNLKKTSLFLDLLTREILLLIMEENIEYDIFKKPQTNNNKPFEDYFQKLTGITYED